MYEIKYKTFRNRKKITVTGATRRKSRSNGLVARVWYYQPRGIEFKTTR